MSLALLFSKEKTLACGSHLDSFMGQWVNRYINPIVQYLAALRKLAKRYDLNDFLHQALHDKLVCGIRNESLQRKWLAKADLIDLNMQLKFPKEWKQPIIK